MINSVLKLSSVLLPIVKQNNQLQVIFTRRTNQLSSHSSQICFPGGKVEDGETDEQTALREFREETGIKNIVEIIGSLSEQTTSTNYKVYPFVGIIKDNINSSLFNIEEVQEIIFVPLDFITNINYYHLNTNPSCKIIQHKYCITYNNYFIWGVTATIARNIAQRVTLVDKVKTMFPE